MFKSPYRIPRTTEDVLERGLAILRGIDTVHSAYVQPVLDAFVDYVMLHGVSPTEIPPSLDCFDDVIRRVQPPIKNDEFSLLRVRWAKLKAQLYLHEHK